MWRATLAMVLTVSVAACASRRSGETPEGPALGATPTLAELDCEGLERDIIQGHDSRTALAAAFGQPDSVNVATESNRHVPGATDSLFVVHYPGLAAGFRKPEGGDDLISHATVRDNRYLRYEAVGIGARAERVIEVLGEPETAERERLVYTCGEGAEEPVTFHLRSDMVDRVEVSYYVD